MVHRKSRLSMTGLSVRSDRLRAAMRQEARQMSRARLMDLAGAKKSALAVDPILASYHGIAVDELNRRAALGKRWGREAPELPHAFAAKVLGKLRAFSDQ